jgi:hypothetical protein
MAAVGLLFFGWSVRTLEIIVYQGALFWLLFDYTLNEMRRKFNNEKWLHWWYVGEAAWTDRIFGDQHGYTYRYVRLFLLKILPLTVVVIWTLK